MFSARKSHAVRPCDGEVVEAAGANGMAPEKGAEGTAAGWSIGRERSRTPRRLVASLPIESGAGRIALLTNALSVDAMCLLSTTAGVGTSLGEGDEMCQVRRSRSTSRRSPRLAATS